jgi:alkanesulfonate monooxygenase SsuD/methylene tetrahydromethanopterin reductase-like flavin-dependent oxidoreductase (luciferase family)
MEPMTTLGTIFLPQFPPERLHGVVRAADQAGLEELWLWEDCFLESGIATAAAALAWTERLRVGVGVLPVPLRNVALTAMELATLHRLFPGRLEVGVGHGVLDWMGQVGARVESPMTLLREYVDALRALLRGEQVTVSGRYVRLDRVALDWPPPSPPAIYVGAVGPRTLRLSGESGDGTILTGDTTADRVREARRLIDDGRAAGGRTDAHRVVVYLRVGTGPSGIAGPANGIAVPAEAPALADAVQEWAEAGADSVVLQPSADDPDPEGFVRFVATEVRPLLPA